MSVVWLSTFFNSGIREVKKLVFIFKMISQIKETDEITERNHSDFTIEHILKHAGNKFTEQSSSSQEEQHYQGQSNGFSWLHCTRFCPPKIPSELYFLF